MKPFSTFLLRRMALLSFVLLIFGICQTASAASGGRLIIKRSPVLGKNVAITIRIDGKLAGTLSYNRTFETILTPGRHVLTAVPNRLDTPWQGTLEVRPNETYHYTAHFAVSRLVLERNATTR
jgi:hypothetical protein